MSEFLDLRLGPETTIIQFFGGDAATEEKRRIVLYSDQVSQWVVSPAEVLLESDDKKPPERRHNGIAALMVLVSFLEPHGCYLLGEVAEESFENFKAGYNALAAFVASELADSSITDNSLVTTDRLWTLGRCGLFHIGQTQGELVISNEFVEEQKQVYFSVDGGAVGVSVRRFCEYVDRYKKHYIKSLHAGREGRESDDDKRWENFKKFQEHLLGVAKDRYTTYRANVQKIVKTLVPLTGSAVRPKTKPKPAAQS